MGATLNEVNGVPVHTLQDLRKSLKDHAHNKFLTFLLSDNLTMTTDNVFVVLPTATVVAQEAQLAHDYHYPMTETAKEILKLRGFSAQI